MDRLFSIIDEKFDEWSKLLDESKSDTVKLPIDISQIEAAQKQLEELIKNREDRKRLDIELQNRRLDEEKAEREKNAPERLAKREASKKVFEKLDELAKSGVELDFEKPTEELELPPQVTSISYYQDKLLKNFLSRRFGSIDLSKIDEADKEALNRLFLQNGRCKNTHDFGIREKDIQYFFYSKKIDDIVGDAKIGKYFTTEDYITCRQSAPKYIDKESVYSVKITPKVYVIIDSDPNEPWTKTVAVIPPKTKFKIIKITDQKIIELEIASQTFPKADERVTKALEEKLPNYIAERQNEAWRALKEDPRNGKLDQSTKERYGLTYYDPYLYLLAEKQRPYLLEGEDKEEAAYTAEYSYSATTKKLLNDIFEDIKPLEKPITVFRSMDINEMDAIVEHHNIHNSEPFEYTDDIDNHLSGFLSTSVSLSVAVGYFNSSDTVQKGYGILKLTIPDGKKVIVPEVTDRSSTVNYEIVLQRKNLHIRIDNITKVKGASESYCHFIEATVV